MKLFWRGAMVGSLVGAIIGMLILAWSRTHP